MENRDQGWLLLNFLARNLLTIPFYGGVWQALDEQQKTLKQQIANQEKKVMDSLADQKQVKAMEAAVEEKRKAFETASQAAAKVETKVQKVHGKIMELTEGKMNKAREKLDAVVSQISKVSSPSVGFLF